MSDLPEVRLASCGHGFLPLDVPPAAVMQNGMHQVQVYLCDDCRQRLNARKVETKPGPAVVRKMQYELPRNPELEADEPPPMDLASDLSPYAKGAKVARDGGAEEDCPFSDRRTKDAKEWLRGFREEFERRNAHGDRTDA